MATVDVTSSEYTRLSITELGNILNRVKLYLALYAKLNSSDKEALTSDVSVVVQVEAEGASGYHCGAVTNLSLEVPGYIPLTQINASGDMYTSGGYGVPFSIERQFTVQHNQDGTGQFDLRGVFYSSPAALSVTKDITDTAVLPSLIDPPTLPEASAFRANEDSQLSSTGEYVMITAVAIPGDYPLVGTYAYIDGDTETPYLLYEDQGLYYYLAPLPTDTVFSQHEITIFTIDSHNHTAGTILTIPASSVPIDMVDDGEGNVGLAIGGFARPGYFDNYLALGAGFTTSGVDKIYETGSETSSVTISNFSDYVGFIVVGRPAAGHYFAATFVPAALMPYNYTFQITDEGTYNLIRTNGSGTISADKGCIIGVYGIR